MSLEDLLKAVRTRPFIPFRLLLTHGESLDVRHPEMCMPGARSTVIGLILSSQTQPIYDVATIVDLLHIVRLEPIQQAAPSSGSARSLPDLPPVSEADCRGKVQVASHINPAASNTGPSTQTRR
jgi:hypothetical protein